LKLRVKCDEPLSNFAFNVNLRPHVTVNYLEQGNVYVDASATATDVDANGRAAQVDPMRPVLKAPGTKRLKLKCDILLSTSAFKFKLRRHTTAPAWTPPPSSRRPSPATRTPPSCSRDGGWRDSGCSRTPSSTATTPRTPRVTRRRRGCGSSRSSTRARRGAPRYRLPDIARHVI